MMKRGMFPREILLVLVAVLGTLLLTGAGTLVSFINQVGDGPYIDPRSFGAICDGNTANAGVDTAGIQAAMDAVQYANGGAGGSGAPYTGHVPTRVMLPSGQCSINAVLIVHKPNVIIDGRGVGANDNSKTGSWLNAVSTFNGPMIRTSSEDIYNYPSAGQGQNTQVVRGVQFHNFGIDLTAATAASNFTAHWAIEAFSTSDIPDFINNVWVLGQRGGCFLISTSLSSSANNIMYDPEQTGIRNFMCFSNGNVPTGSGILIKGANEITVDTGSISIGNAGFVTPSGTNDENNAAGVEVTSDSVGNFGNHINIKNVHVTDYAVHFRVRGADQTLIPVGGGCTTHPGCTNPSPQHYGPAWVHFTGNECESWHICLCIRCEGNPSGFGTNRTTLESTWDDSNTIYFPNGGFVSTARIAWVDMMQGGEVNSGARAAVYATNVPVILGSGTVGIKTTLYYDTGSVNSLAIQSTGNNLIQVAVARLSFSQLPRCFFSTCTPPSTDAPYGVSLVCTDCTGTSGGIVSGSSFGRGVYSNGGSWLAY